MLIPPYEVFCEVHARSEYHFFLMYGSVACYVVCRMRETRVLPTLTISGVWGE
jgi:hypothetical protein